MSTFLDERPPTRGTDLNFLTETGYILAGSVTDDGGGGGSVALNTAGTFPCRIDAMGGREGEIASRISDRSTHLVTLPPQTVIELEQDFQIDGIGAFEVTAVRQHTHELSRAIEVVAK